MNDKHPIEDDILVLRCREGDAAALETLLTRWQERLWRHALRVTGDSEAAWDILQEALLVIARKIHKLEAASAFAVWAYRVTRNKANDWLRRNRRRLRRDTHYAASRSLVDQGEDDSLERGDGLQRAIARLPHSERALLAMRYEDDFGTDEIADMLGIPVGTVKSRLHYIKQRLRTLMGEQP